MEKKQAMEHRDNEDRKAKFQAMAKEIGVNSFEGLLDVLRGIVER